jgi:hypothetical protein
LVRQCAIVAGTNVANFHLELERNHAIVMIENRNWLLATLPHRQHLTSETQNPKPEAQNPKQTKKQNLLFAVAQCTVERGRCGILRGIAEISGFCGA